MKESIITSAKANLQKLYTLLKHLAVLMLFFMLTRFIFYFFNTAYYPEMTFSRFIRILHGGMVFDMSAILFINSFYIILALLPLPFSHKPIYRKSISYWFIVTNAIAISVNLADAFYFDFTVKRTTADVFSYTGEDNLGILLLSFLKNYWYGFLIGIALIGLFIFTYKKIKLKQVDTGNLWSYIGIGIIFLGICGFLSVMGMRGSFVPKTFPITLGDAGKYTEKTQDMSLVLNTPFTILKTIEKQALKEKHDFKEEELADIYTPIHNPNLQEQFKSLNVVILVMESFSREVIGSMNPRLGRKKSLTPFLETLIDKSLSYPRAFANGRQSISALPAITSSIPYARQPFVTSTYASNDISSLGKTLKNKGYSTSFFHGAQNGSIGLGAFMKLAGYDNYFGMEEYGNDDDFDGSWGIFDDKFFPFFLEKLNTFQQPFHSVMFSLSSHNPYVIPEEFEKMFSHKKNDRKKTYLYTDYVLKKFFEEAEKQPWYKNTLFVITSDHSAKLWDKWYMTNVNSYAIPIIFYCPSDPGLTGTNSTVVQHLDIMPSVLDYLNYDKEYFSFGRSCFDTLNNGAAYINQNNTWEYISGDYVLTESIDKGYSLYNYMQDNFLKSDSARHYPEKTEAMKKHLKAFIQQHNNRMIKNRLTVIQDAK